MLKCIICDLDGTLCDISERRKFIEQESKDWVNFSKPENIAKDGVFEWCVALINAMNRVGIAVIFVSGRMSKDGVEDETKNWITKYLRIPIAELNLFLRKDKDYRPDIKVKEDIYNEHIKDKYKVLFCIDDRQCVVDMWRNKGITCLQCAEGNF